MSLSSILEDTSHQPERDGGLTSRVSRIGVGEHGSGSGCKVSVGAFASTVSLGSACEYFVASIGTDGQGARSRRETVASRPSMFRTFAYIGLTSRSSTWSTRGSFVLVRTNLRRRTGPGECSHEGIDVPQDERRWKLKNLSCGVVFVDVERSDRMECRASGRTTSHLESGRFLDFREIPCPLLLGW